MAANQPTATSGIDYYAKGLQLGFQGGQTVALSWDFIQLAVTPGNRPRGDRQHNGTTDPGLKVVGVRDCSNKFTVSGTSYERLPIYELWDKTNHTPIAHYTLFEQVRDTSGQITLLTKCADQTNTGTTPCEYADGSNILFNVFQDDIAIGNSPETVAQQYFVYGLPGQRLWESLIYRTLPDGSTVEFVPSSHLTLHLKPQVEPLIQEQSAPYMGPWFNSNTRYASCNTSGPPA